MTSEILPSRRSRSSLPSEEPSNCFRAGETAISPGPGILSRPGGTGASGPSAHRRAPSISLSRNSWSALVIRRVSRPGCPALGEVIVERASPRS